MCLALVTKVELWSSGIVYFLRTPHLAMSPNKGISHECSYSLSFLDMSTAGCCSKWGDPGIDSFTSYNKHVTFLNPLLSQIICFDIHHSILLGLGILIIYTRHLLSFFPSSLMTNVASSGASNSGVPTEQPKIPRKGIHEEQVSASKRFRHAFACNQRIQGALWDAHEDHAVISRYETRYRGSGELSDASIFR